MIETGVQKKSSSVTISVIFYLIMLLNCGFHFCTVGGAYEYISIGLAFLIFVFGNMKAQTTRFVRLLALLIIVSISSIINGDTIKTTIVIMFDLVSAYLIASYCKDAKRTRTLVLSYRNIIIIISIFSVVTYLLSIVNNSLFYSLPSFTSGNHTTYFTGLSFVYRIRRYGYLRNPGIFWEPGAFQTFIILALMIELFFVEKNERKIWRVIVLNIAMITTISTTGIISLVLLWVVYSFTQPKKGKTTFILAIIAFILIIFISNPQYMPEAFRFALVDKVGAASGEAGELETVDVRADSVIYPLKAFLKSPFWGVGKIGMSAWEDEVGHNMNTCTPINWLAHYGIFMFLIIIKGFYNFTKLFADKSIHRVLILIVFLISISTEAFNYEPTILWLCFLGYGIRQTKKT